MNNAEDVKKVYDQIHAPEALLGKVMEMKKDTFKFRNGIKFALVAVAALVLTFVAGNGICYAATGETLFSKIKVSINGKEVTPEVTWEERDGNMVGSFEMELDSMNEETGEPDSVYAQIEVLPDGISVDEFATEDIDGLEDTVVLTIVTTGEGGNISVEQTEDELTLSIDTPEAE